MNERCEVVPDGDLGQMVHLWSDCGQCGSTFYMNRYEPYCLNDHPNQYHLQRVTFSETPCASCLTWKEPMEAFYADSEHHGYMFPPIRQTT